MQNAGKVLCPLFIVGTSALVTAAEFIAAALAMGLEQAEIPEPVSPV